MSVRNVALDVDNATLDLAVAELREAADRRHRVAERLSGELTASKRADAKLDIRTGATHVVRTLGEADDLRALAEQLHAARRGLPTPRRSAAAAEPPTPVADEEPSPLEHDDDDDHDGEVPDPADPDIAAARRALGLESSFDGDDLGVSAAELAALEALGAEAAHAAGTLDLDAPPAIPDDVV